MIPFVKAHACGNDFLIVEEQFAGQRRAELAVRLCDRHAGVGADGIEWLDTAGSSPRITLSNADGSEAEISGNGTRCVAAWLASRTGASELEIVTGAGTKRCSVLSRNGQTFQIETSMGTPIVGPLMVDQFSGVRVSMGNPHFVLMVDDFPDDWAVIGERLSRHAAFSRGSNIEFARTVDGNSIELRIFERGAGPTLSSGTGSCAAAVAAMQARNMPRELRVMTQGGEQRVRWEGEVFLTGTAELIAQGEAWL